MRKLLLKTYGDLVRYLWATSQGLSPLSERINIIFDSYRNQSIKEGERRKRNQGGVETSSLQLKQSLPVKIENFCGFSNNKIQLKQIFIKWIIKSYKNAVSRWW